MAEKIDLLINILLDDNARIDEKDDAIISLGGLQDIRAIASLRKIATDDSQDYLLKSSAGESIARIMIDLNYFDKRYIENLTDDAKNEAKNLLLAKNPDWHKLIDDAFN